MCKVSRVSAQYENATRRPSELQCRHTWLVVGIKGVTLLGNDFLHQPQGTPKVHVVADTLGLPTEHGGVAPEACLEFCLCQQVHPDHLACMRSCEERAPYEFEDNEEAQRLRRDASDAKVI